MKTNFSSTAFTVTYLGSAGVPKQFPEHQLREFCLLGRSNVGKSSFINHVLRNKNIARVAKTPGKTARAHFFAIDQSFALVDLPGYGYAKVSHSERKLFSSVIQSYCSQRKQLQAIIWLIDSRHPGIKTDIEAAHWLQQLNKEVIIVATKIDKLKPAQVKKSLAQIATCFGAHIPIIPFTIRDISGVQMFWEVIDGRYKL